MGILNNGFGLISPNEVQRSEFSKNEFQEGLVITEVINGTADEKTSVKLIGLFMPKDTFDDGGKQTVVKTKYAGSSYKSVQILGDDEDDVTIRGTLEERNLTVDLAGAAEQYKIRLDQIRKTGNILLVSLGDYWKRYCILEETHFKMHNLKKIDYELKFSVIGVSLPKNYYFVDGKDLDVKTPNNDLLTKAAAHQALLESKPLNVPVTVSDIINSAINDVGSLLTGITSFVDGILGDAEKIVDSATKAVGLIKNARALTVKSMRRLGSIVNDSKNLAPSFLSEREKILETIKNSDYIHKVMTSNKEVNRSLVALQAKLSKYINSIPFKRHLVIDGDSLQKISIKYYGTADHWIAIMEHNKLASTTLVVGSVLEIPRI